MHNPPEFQLCILSPTRCRLKNEEEGWSKDFHSAKGALDFIEEEGEGARITITDTIGAEELVNTTEPGAHQTSAQRIE